MGYFRHHAIIVTSFDDNSIETAHKKAKEICVAFSPLDDHIPISEITLAVINGCRSFFIAPDGSKEGWNVSDHGNKVRADFVYWMQHAYKEHHLSLDWALVQFGDEDGDDRLLLSNRRDDN